MKIEYKGHTIEGTPSEIKELLSESRLQPSNPEIKTKRRDGYMSEAHKKAIAEGRKRQLNRKNKNKKRKYVKSGKYSKKDKRKGKMSEAHKAAIRKAIVRAHKEGKYSRDTPKTSKKRNNRYTSREKSYILNHYSKENKEKIAKKLGCTPKQVYDMYYHLTH